MHHEFDEVLNDLIDYFLLGDLLLLQRFKQQHGLPDDLAQEFITRDSGDQVVLDGVMIPMAGVENHPYRVLFTLPGSQPQLLDPECRLQHRRAGYGLRVEHGRIHLYTWRILQNFNEEKLQALLERYRQWNGPTIELDNGWYEVEVLAGELKRDGYFEPAFEFVLNPVAGPVDASGVDVGYRFAVQWTQT